MNKFIMAVLLTVLWLGLSAAKWQTLTNTSHVYDLTQQGNRLFFSTWGGVIEINMPDPYAMEQTGIWTTANGIASNDVRSVAYIASSQSLWFGTAYDGISILSPAGIQQLNVELGLPSNTVTGIIENGAEILVSTRNGLGLFYYLEGVNFPLMLDYYNVQNTNGNLLSNQIDAMVLAPSTETLESNGYLYLSSSEGLNFVHLDSLAVNSAWHRFTDLPIGNGTVNRLSASVSKLVLASLTAVCTHSIDPWSPGWQVFGASQGLLPSPIASAGIDDGDNLWVSYGRWNEDILAFQRDIDTLMTSIQSDGEVRHWAELENELGDKTVSKIIVSLGSIFLCTWGDGIYHLTDLWQNRDPANYVVTHFQPNSIGFPKIRSITIDQNNANWFSSGSLNHIPLKKSSLGTSRYKDGTWTNLNVANSPIHTDNILSVAVDSRNRKWFGTYDVNHENGSPLEWDKGVSVWDEESDTWTYIKRPTLLGDTDVHISRDLHGNMLVACFDDGFTVFGPSDYVIAQFQIPNSVHQRVIYSHHSGRQYFFGTYNDRGLVIWNEDSLPVTDGDHWLIPPVPELSNCEIYGVVSAESPYEGNQHWIAASNGLFMWDEQDWYKYDTSIKRSVYDTVSRTWENDILYYADEERLFGSARTTPTAIFLDPFNQIWIGSLENGFSMYDLATERFTNYYIGNSPLLSSYITAFGYDPEEGNLLVGTPDGLNTLHIGRTLKPETDLESLKIYPNPYNPDLEPNPAQILNSPSDILPRGQNHCRVYDSAGALVIELKENRLSRFEWDGRNAAGSNCSSGIYYVVVTDEKGNRRSGKLALVR